MAQDPALEARVMVIAEELRCLVCQNETIAASHADLAVDLRNQIRVKLRQGQSPGQIRDFMVQRYGDFVLYQPAAQASGHRAAVGRAFRAAGAGRAVKPWARPCRARRRAGRGPAAQR